MRDCFSEKLPESWEQTSILFFYFHRGFIPDSLFLESLYLMSTLPNTTFSAFFDDSTPNSHSPFLVSSLCHLAVQQSPVSPLYNPFHPCCQIQPSALSWITFPQMMSPTMATPLSWYQPCDSDTSWCGSCPACFPVIHVIDIYAAKYNLPSLSWMRFPWMTSPQTATPLFWCQPIIHVLDIHTAKYKLRLFLQ